MNYSNSSDNNENSDVDVSDVEEEENINSVSLFFVKQIEKHPEVLLKSQLPAMKAKKDQAIKEISKAYELHVGKPSTVQQVLKKINNMKTRLKSKTDKKKTGNKKIVLKPWEKMLYHLMNGEENPTINKIPGL